MLNGLIEPWTPSNVIAEIISAFIKQFLNLLKAKHVYAEINWVPLIKARPSFSLSDIRDFFSFCKTFLLSTSFPLYRTFPSPINGKNKWDKGAKSPEAPTEPCDGTIGIILLSICQQILSITSILMPENPLHKEWTFIINISLEISKGTFSPTPTAWLFSKFSCNNLESSFEIIVLHKTPIPVLTP